MFIFKAGPRKVFRLKPVRCAKKVADPCFSAQNQPMLACLEISLIQTGVRSKEGMFDV